MKQFFGMSQRGRLEEAVQGIRTPQFIMLLSNNEQFQEHVQALDIHVDGEYVDLRYQLAPRPFSRIRRITGYLVGDMSHWNNAKAAEERDRVKHI